MLKSINIFAPKFKFDIKINNNVVKFTYPRTKISPEIHLKKSVGGLRNTRFQKFTVFTIFVGN